MPGKRLQFSVEFTRIQKYQVDVDVGVGYARPSAQFKFVTDLKKDYISPWVADASEEPPVQLEGPVAAMECRVTHPQALGYVMMTQVLWVPNQKKDMEAVQKAGFGKMTEYGNGVSVVDGGHQSPAKSFGDGDKPHKTYPFFAYSPAYYADFGIGQRVMRAKDYASAAKNHTALVFNCDLVVKLQPGDEFGVIGSFIWGVGVNGELILRQREGGMSDVSQKVLAKEYKHCKFEQIGGTDSGTPLNTAYKPFEEEKSGGQNKLKDKYGLF